MISVRPARPALGQVFTPGSSTGPFSFTPRKGCTIHSEVPTAAPTSAQGPARSMRTVTRSPGEASPAKCTSLFWRVRPYQETLPAG